MTQINRKDYSQAWKILFFNDFFLVVLEKLNIYNLHFLKYYYHFNNLYNFTKNEKKKMRSAYYFLQQHLSLYCMLKAEVYSL
jgi:hypothetical protein